MRKEAHRWVVLWLLAWLGVLFVPARSGAYP
jgi:hypothetical protein